MPDIANDRRQQLRILSRTAKGGLLTVSKAAAALGESSRATALRLARLARGGWISRVKRGLYYVPPLDAGPNVVAEDPWILAATLFEPCYIGGWSAAEHWGLTEQLFRSTFVATAAHIRAREQSAAGVAFHLARVSPDRVESVRPHWRGSVRVRVSDPERTIVDALVSPAWVGGMRHLADILVAYRETREASVERLADSLARHGNGAAHKRAGFLAETLWPDAAALVALAKKGMTAGVVKLDPAVAARGRMNTRWGLWINVRLRDGATIRCHRVLNHVNQA